MPLKLYDYPPTIQSPTAYSLSYYTNSAISITSGCCSIAFSQLQMLKHPPAAPSQSSAPSGGLQKQLLSCGKTLPTRPCRHSLSPQLTPVCASPTPSLLLSVSSFAASLLHSALQCAGVNILPYIDITVTTDTFNIGPDITSEKKFQNYLLFQELLQHVQPVFFEDR